MAVKGLGHRDHAVNNFVKVIVLTAAVIGGVLLVGQGLGGFNSNAKANPTERVCNMYRAVCSRNNNYKICTDYKKKCLKVSLTPTPTKIIITNPPIELTRIPQPTNTRLLLKICPDVWIINKMPMVRGDDDGLTGESAYFIINGVRRNISEFDVDWIKLNCKVQPQYVY